MLQVSDILKTNPLLRYMCTHCKEPQQVLDESHILDSLLDGTLNHRSTSIHVSDTSHLKHVILYSLWCK